MSRETGEDGRLHRSAAVLDLESGRWLNGVSSPNPVVGDSDEEALCTTDRVVAFGGRTSPSEATLDTFDPATLSWRTLPLPEIQGGPVLGGRPGLHDVVISSMGVGLEAPAVVFDPVTGRSTPTDLSFTGPADYVGITPESALVFERDGSFSVSDVDA